MSGTQWGWSGLGANAPVGARLFGPRVQSGPPEVPPLAALLPSRAQRERAMINALYGLGVYGPEFQPGGSQPGLSPETWAALNAPVQPQNLPPPVVPQGFRGNSIPSPAGSSDPIVIPPTIPPELDPSGVPRTPAARPEDRASAAPQNPGEANWMALLQRYLPRRGQADEGPAPDVPTDYPTDRLLPGMQAARRRRMGWAYPDNPGIMPDSLPPVGPEQTTGPNAPTETLPTPPVPPEGPLPGTDNAAAAAPERTRYATFQGQLPTGQAALDAYYAARPKERERNPEERTLRLIAAALAGGSRETGLGVGGGAAAGLGAGYSQESDRDEAIWQRSEAERQRFQQGLAGLLGQQEQRAFDNAMSQQTFNRQSQALGDQDSRAREGLAIQRQAASEQGMLRRLRMARLLEQSGMETNPAQVLSRGIEHVVSNPGTQILLTDSEGRTRPLTFRVGQQELTLAQLQDRLLQARGNPANARTNPLFATNPQLARDQTRADLADMLMQRVMTLSPAEQRQVLQQLLPMLQSRARAGSQTLSGADE